VRNYEGTACCQESCKSMHEVRRVAPFALWDRRSR
jgi:hypothetical protein